MKLGSLPSTAGSAAAKGTAWTGGVGAGGEGGVDVGRAGGEEGATLFLLVTRPSSIASSSLLHLLGPLEEFSSLVSSR